jgi:hypothetical protein
MSEMGHSRRVCHIRYTSGYRLISDIDRVKAKPARTRARGGGDKLFSR